MKTSMKVKSILSLFIALSASSVMAEGSRVASMHARFSGLSSKSGSFFEIKQSEDGKWSVNETQSCNHAPCEARAERLHSLSFTPEVVSPANLPDGGIQIKLGDKLMIHTVTEGIAMLPDSRTYYELVIFDENKTVVDHIELRFMAFLDTPASP